MSRWDCPVIRLRLSRYLDAELTDRSSARVERHLAVCPDCQRELDRLFQLVQRLGGSTATDPPADSWEQVGRRLAMAGVHPFSEGVSIRWEPGRIDGGRRRLSVAVAAAALLVLALLPFAAGRLATPPDLLHEIDVSALLEEIRRGIPTSSGVFWDRYHMRVVDVSAAARLCPSGRPPAREVPAGFVLARSMLVRTDCCEGLLLEYRRGDALLRVVEIPSHHPMDWGTETYRTRRSGMETFEVHEESGLASVVRTGGPLNILVTGPTDAEVLVEVASFLNARSEASLTPDGR